MGRIYGIGVDVVQISRIEKTVERWKERFLKRVFTDKEISYCYQKAIPYPSLAARFAAKEAFVKTLGELYSYKEIETVNNGKGQPILQLHGKTKNLFIGKAGRGARIHLSLSHDANIAIAFVLVEQ